MQIVKYQSLELKTTTIRTKAQRCDLVSD